MNYFEYRKRELYAEDVPLRTIADAVGTPTYVYSSATLKRHVRVMKEAFGGEPHLVCYSVKANSNLAILRLLHDEGCGFDIVSGGELQRVRVASRGDSRQVVFAGVGKTPDEMAQALDAQILLFNVESAEELEMLDKVAREKGTRAPFAIRVNPNVDARTHKYIATGLKETLARLKANGIEGRERTVPVLGLHQVFIDDPNGIVVELNFPAAEKAALGG